MIGRRPLAVITGGARRVGRATAIEFARHGFDLILTANTRIDEALGTIDACRAVAGGDFAGRAIQADLDDPRQTASLAAEISRLDRLDALIHNAGSFSPSPLGTLTGEQLLSHYRVNAASPALLTAAAADLLRRSDRPGGGCVVCFSDIHVLGRPRRDHLAYAMSKAALSAMIESLAIDLAPRVRVLGIAPGVVAWPDDADPDEIRAYEARIPLGRSGTPEDAARLVRLLVCDVSYITGEIIRLDGGRWLR